MTHASETPALSTAALAPPQRKVLHRLYLTLFLRGHSARGLQKDKAPKSIGAKLTIVLTSYGLLGLMSLVMIGQTVFAAAIYQHAMTFFMLGTFIAASAGEVLFNAQEADILLHRPIEPRTLLWAKVRVLIEVSLWLAGAFNLIGLFIGVFARDGNGFFPLVHGASIVLEAIFGAGCVVLTYQLCLKWFGRERLEGLMTTAQVILTLGMVLGAQILPRLMLRVGKSELLHTSSPWMWLIPPAWFAGMDDALTGSGATSSWLLAACAVSATAIVTWGAFGKLARSYETGLQRIGERSQRPAAGRRFRRLDRLIKAPLLRWWLRDPVVRSSFLLTAAYLARDRETKLRFYPGVAPILILPIFPILSGRASDTEAKGDFMFTFVSSFLGLIPLLTLHILQYSQQWQASDILRAAPLPGPARVCEGARKAVLLLVAMPAVVMYTIMMIALAPDAKSVLLLIPGLISMPLFALVPHVGGRAVPLSKPPEEAKSAGRGLTMIGAMIASMALAGVATGCWNGGVFAPFLLAEVVMVAGLYALLRRGIRRAEWAIDD